MFWCFFFWLYPQLPETIPTHFNGVGTADAWGSKSSAYALLGINTALFALVSFACLNPRYINFPTPVTPENAPRLYAVGARALRFLKCVLLILFFAVLVQTASTAGISRFAPLFWLLPVALSLLFVTIIWMLVVMSRAA